MDGLFRLGNEDTGLAFTMYGFDRYMKLAHFQYYAATIESDCHDEKTAKKRWTKVSKMTESLPSPEFVFPLLAAARLDANAGAAQDRGGDSKQFAPLWRKPIRRHNRRSSMLEAMLLSASGKHPEAMSRFQQALKSGDLMIQYLSLTEMNQVRRKSSTQVRKTSALLRHNKQSGAKRHPGRPPCFPSMSKIISRWRRLPIA